jgi:hypothetical protein
MEDNASNRSTIQAHRKLTEERLRQVLGSAKSMITVETVKQAIFQAENADFHRILLDVLAALHDADIDGPDDPALQAIQDAWNYFPHCALGGSCPAELVMTAMHEHDRQRADPRVRSRVRRRRHEKSEPK